MTNAELILQFCKQQGKPVTAMQIIDACFPGKPQPYINTTINKLIQEKKLIRNDMIRPYTIRIPKENEEIPEPKDYSKGSRIVNYFASKVYDESNILKFTDCDLAETAQKVKDDRRYGEEAIIICNCFNRFQKNVDADVVALKIALIDMTNSTNLNMHLAKVSLKNLVQKIIDCDFDKRVEAGSISLIKELSENEINLFSFATKYCLYHNYYVYRKDDYAIFDGVIQKHLGKYISHYEYKGKTYASSQIHNCIEKMRKNYDYESYLNLIDTVINNNNITIPDKHRKFDWFIWYKYR